MSKCSGILYAQHAHAHALKGPRKAVVHTPCAFTSVPFSVDGRGPCSSPGVLVINQRAVLIGRVVEDVVVHNATVWGQVNEQHSRVEVQRIKVHHRFRTGTRFGDDIDFVRERPGTGGVNLFTQPELEGLEGNCGIGLPSGRAVHD